MPFLLSLQGGLVREAVLQLDELSNRIHYAGVSLKTLNPYQLQWCSFVADPMHPAEQFNLIKCLEDVYMAIDIVDILYMS